MPWAKEEVKIRELKNSREKEAGYMKFAELLEETKQEGIEQGRGMAVVKILLSLLSEKGNIPADLKETIEKETDVDKLEVWVKLAAHSESIEEFEKNI